MKLRAGLGVSVTLWLVLLISMIPLVNAASITVYTEDFSSGGIGWSFLGSTNNWQVGPLPFGGGPGLGTGLGGYYQDGVGSMSEARMPNGSISGLSNVIFSFSQWYNFSDSLNDGGGIYLWNGSAYINPLNDFPSAVMGDLNFQVIAGLAYSGHPNEKGWAYNSSGGWRQVTINLSRIGIQNSDFHVNFVFGETGADINHGQGWFIDNITIIGDQPEGNGGTGGNDLFYWILIIAGIIIVGIIVYNFWRKSKTAPKVEEKKLVTTPSGTPLTTPTNVPTTSPSAPTPSSVTTPSSTSTGPTVRWKRIMGDYENENPLYDNGYSYEIYFEVPCTITPAPDQVIVAHVVITVTVTCKNGVHTLTYDYWEAFTLHDPKNDKTTTPDKHYVDKSDLEADIMRRTGCDQILSYTVTRTHTVNLGTVAGAAWNNQMDGGAFAYLKNGPPPDNSPSTPSSRPDAPVQGSVTGFSTAGATTFTGTYTYDGQTGTSTYTSSLNPGVTYTYP